MPLKDPSTACSVRARKIRHSDRSKIGHWQFTGNISGENFPSLQRDINNGEVEMDGAALSEQYRAWPSKWHEETTTETLLISTLNLKFTSSVSNTFQEISMRSQRPFIIQECLCFYFTLFIYLFICG